MSLIDREELLRRLKLHGRRKDGKTVIPFATSGGSGMGKTLEGLKKSCNGNLVPGSMFNRSTSLDELRRLAGL